MNGIGRTMRFTSPRLVVTVAIGAAAVANAASAQAPAETDAAPVEINVRADDPGTPFPHFWEQIFGSGRAALALRDDYRQDVRLVKGVTGFQYVRFHGIFHDEVGLYDIDTKGTVAYNFSYIDQIYDGLLADGVRPFVELSFMPQALASHPKEIFGFWYKPNISPPKSYAQWDAMIDAFVRHLVDRYGIDEVATWYFEVWNEPNIDFWNGIPRQRSYFDLYAHTARDLKSVSPRLRVGGPATAASAWVDDFLKFTSANRVPVDFVSTHAYADDTTEDLSGKTKTFPWMSACAALWRRYTMRSGPQRNPISRSSSPNGICKA
jgi:xylan 1,4-beta-xylosidase